MPYQSLGYDLGLYTIHRHTVLVIACDPSALLRELANQRRASERTYQAVIADLSVGLSAVERGWSTHSLHRPLRPPCIR